MGATVGINNIRRNGAMARSIFPSARNVIDATVSFNAGDLLVLKTGLIQTSITKADYEFFLGVSLVTVVLGVLKGPYTGLTAVDASVGISDIPGPQFGVVAEFFATAGETYVAGDKIYFNEASATNTAQTVSNSSDTASRFLIGYFQGPGVVATATTKIEVLIGSNFGMDGLNVVATPVIYF